MTMPWQWCPGHWQRSLCAGRGDACHYHVGCTRAAGTFGSFFTYRREGGCGWLGANRESVCRAVYRGAWDLRGVAGHGSGCERRVRRNIEVGWWYVYAGVYLRVCMCMPLACSSCVGVCMCVICMLQHAWCGCM